MSKPAVIIAGTQSGSGKTTITIGIMAALANWGLKVQPFKCGPDFIDPTLHQLVTGQNSRNLDPWMTGPEFCQQTFAQHSAKADISVVEGVMGMFDGDESSSASLAKLLNIPVILVVDVSASAESVAAIVHGFESFDSEVEVMGVILNKIASANHLEIIETAIEKQCQTKILGHLPRSLNFKIPERHLGLHMGDETPLTPASIAELAKTITEFVDIDQLLTIDNKSSVEPVTFKITNPQVRIAVAQDQAFCFYYQDNLDILTRAGAEIVPFSPLADSKLPDDIDAVYLGGGYPELFARKLSTNQDMRHQLKSWAEYGGPVYAECGGFMYLTKEIKDQEGTKHPMVGIYPVAAEMKTSRATLGYQEITLNSESFFGAAGTIMRGHEFHYSDIEEMPEDIPRIYDINETHPEGYQYKNVLGGYLHLHFGFNPKAITTMIANIKEISRD